MYQETDIEYVNKRLKQFVDGLDDNVSDVLSKTGINRSTLYNMFKDGGTIKHQNLIALRDVYGLDIGRLFNEDKDVPKNNTSAINETANIYGENADFDTDEFYTIPFHPQVKASAGGGMIPQEAKPPLQIAFRKYYISNKLHCQAKDLVAIKVEGDSMQPTLLDDDVILIDESQREPKSGKILVIRIDETISCKRVQELPGHRYKVISDNDIYEPFIIEADEPGFEIVGQVVWYARDLV